MGGRPAIEIEILWCFVGYDITLLRTGAAALVARRLSSAWCNMLATAPSEMEVRGLPRACIGTGNVGVH